MELAEAKSITDEEADRVAPDLLQVARSIHENPEPAFEEHHAHEVLTGVLEDGGFTVTRHAFDLPTAFEASVGPTDGPKLAIVCDYDAIPGVGHGSGRNIAAAAGIGAALAAAEAAGTLGGRVVVLGAPGVAGGNGKDLVLERGGFDDVELAMTLHPADRDLPGLHAIASQQLRVTYLGEAAAASSTPELGRNALDGAVLGYNAVAALRQHIRLDERIHGVFTDGGVHPNVIPATASTHWSIGSTDLDTLETPFYPFRPLLG